MEIRESETPLFFESRKFVPNSFAKYMLDKGKEHFATPTDTEVIHHYINGIYKPNGATYIKGCVETVMKGEHISGRIVSEVVGHIQRKTYIERDEFDKNPDEITVENGVLNTKTFTVKPHNPNNKCLLKIPVTYDPDADCPKFKSFLSEILEDSIERETIIELFGYCLIKNYSIQKWFMFLGSGANGKGTLLSTLRSFLGAENIAAVELQEFEKPFSIAELYGRLANIVGDLSAKELYHSGRLKSLTGGDLLLAEKKFQNPFNFINHAKLIYSANALPKTFDGTVAFWRRVMLINFSKTFVDKGDIKDLWKQFTTKEEMSGILNLAIQGIQRLSENGHFSKENSTEEIEEYYIRNSDPIAAFFMDCVEISNNSDDYISLQALHVAFVEYCKQYRFTDLSIRNFNTDVRNNFRLKETRVMNGETGKQERVWQGVFLSTTEDELYPITSCDSMTERHEEHTIECKNSAKKRILKHVTLGHCVTDTDCDKMMEFIQMKISEYGDASEHAYNVIEALLEKQDQPIKEIEYCIKLHKEGHRRYIPRKEDETKEE